VAEKARFDTMPAMRLARGSQRTLFLLSGLGAAAVGIVIAVGAWRDGFPFIELRGAVASSRKPGSAPLFVS
jgi:type IV secretory pathway TrbD component